MENNFFVVPLNVSHAKITIAWAERQQHEDLFVFTQKKKMWIPIKRNENGKFFNGTQSMQNHLISGQSINHEII